MTSAAQRIAWKENRFLRPVVVGCLVVLAVMCVLGSQFIRRPVDYVEFVFNLTLVLGAIAGLTMGIVLFVFEQETGTQSFLSTLPVDGSAVARSKLFSASINFGVYLLISIVVAVIAVMSFGDGITSPGSSDPISKYALLLVIPLETFLWALICSIWMRSSLNATLLTAGLAVLSFVVIGVLTLRVNIFRNEALDQRLMVGVHFALIVLLGVVVWVSSRQWLRGKPGVVDWRGFTGAKQRNRLANLERTGVSQSLDVIKKAYPMRALFWQTSRCVRWPWLLTAVCLLVFSVLGSFMIYGPNLNQSPAYSLESKSNLLAIFAVAGMVSGMFAFAGDQAKSGYLFFRQRAEYPRRLWLARVLPMLAMLPVAFAAAWILDRNWFGIFQPRAYPNDPGWYWLDSCPYVMNSLIVFLAAAGISQLLTLMIRLSSGFVAFIVVSLAGMGIFLWCRHLTLAGGPLWLFVGPVIFACFATSWWLAPKWISGRLFKRKAAIGAFGCFAVLLASVWGWAELRSNQFAISKSAEFWVDVYENPNANLPEAAAQIKNAIHELNEAENASTSDEALEEKVVGQIVGALAHSDCGLYLNPSSSIERREQVKRLLGVLEKAREKKVSEENREEALKLLMAELNASWFVAAEPSRVLENLLEIQKWAALDGKDEGSIRSALAKLQLAEFQIFSRPDKVAAREAVFSIERAFKSTDLNDSITTRSRNSTTQLPWELERGRRWSLTQRVRMIEHGWNDACNYVSHDGGAVGSLEFLHGWASHNVYRHWIFWSPDSITENVSLRSEPKYVSGFFSMVNAFDYTKVRLALEGFRLQNGAYPEGLHALTVGENPWLDKLPLYAGTGFSYAYSGTGLDAPLVAADFSDVAYRNRHDAADIETLVVDEVIEAGKPFLLPWSGVPLEKRVFVRDTDEREYDFTPSSVSEVGYWVPAKNAQHVDLFGQELKLFELGTNE